MRRPALRPRTLLLGLVFGAAATLACDEYLTDLDHSQLLPATLTRFAVAPDSLDLSVDDAAVVTQVSARAGAGIDSVRVALTGPLGGEAGCAAGAPVAGTVEEGAWECALEIGPGAPLGMWAIDRVTLHHGAAVVELTGAELADAGFASTVRVARTRTMPIPALVSLAFTPERVDVTSGAASLEVLAGLAEPADSLDIDLAGERHQASCTAHREAEESLAYGCAMDVPADAAPDEWRVERVRLFGADTTVVVGPDDLESLDLPTAVAVVIDRTDLMSLTLDPDTVSLPDTVGIRVEVTVRNSARAVDSLGVSLTGPGDGHAACLAVEPSAAFRDLSAWDCTLAFPDGAAGGTWSAEEVRIHPAGRAPDVFAADTLRALGFAIDIVVLEAPDLTAATIVGPADGSTFAAGDTVVFQGTGRDRAGAELTGAALAWASSMDGPLGSGSTVSRADLSVGSHTVTLTATGPAGEVATAEITLVIEAEDSPPVVPEPTGVLAYSGDGIIRTIHADGSNPVTTSRLGTTPRWSPDGSLIAYESSGNRISVMDPDGSNNRVLTDYRTHAPTWSADMAEIATQAAPDVGASYVIMAIDPVSGDSIRRITDTPDADQHPHWSPSGDRIVIVRNGRVTVIRASDGAVLQSFSGGLDWNPSWSPDEQRIVFHQRSGVSPARIAILDLETGGITGLHQEEGVALTAPVWSPDGHWIAFARRPDGAPNFDIWLRRADGHGDAIRLTNDGLNNTRPDWTAEVTTPVHPPAAAIQDPADGTTFLEGASIIFQGTGTSGAGGPLTGSDLVWTSSRDGQIGTGQSFARADLSVGSHTITLRATDPATGMAAQASVTITVEEDDAPPPPDDIRWVAMGGTNQQIATSADGVTWTARSSPFTMTGRGVAYNGARWVAVGQAEYMIATSDDGITWTGRASPFTTAGRGAAWFHDQWVAVGQGGARIATSPDGETWTARASPIAGIAYGIAASDTLIVVGGQTGATLATSTDGVTWTARSNPITGRVMGVAWNGALWVAVGETGARIITSPDGVLWTSRTAPFTRVNGVAWNGELWVAVGQGNATIATSVNGLTWTAQPGSPFTTEANGVAWDGTQWVVVGFGGARLATSTDGINWTPRDTPFSGQVWGVASSVPLYPPPGNAVDEPVPTSITVSGAGPVARGETRQLTATIYDQHRRPMEGVDFEWRTTRPCRVTVDQDGVVTGRSVGASTVSAWVSASVRAPVSISVPAVSGEPPASLTGVWEACDDWDGTHLLTLDLTHEAGAESVTGTVTEVSSGAVRNITFGRWLNEVLELQWSVFVQGGERTSFIAGGTALDPYVLSGTYNDRIRLTTHDVRLIRVDD